MRLIVLMLLLSHVTLFGQGKKINTVKIGSPVVNVAVDRAGDFYVILQTGEIQKYNKQGVLIGSFKHKGIPTLFDPTNAVRLLTYYYDQQEYAWLDSELEVAIPFTKIEPSFAVEPKLICPSGERDAWILDAADFSMKKINQREASVSLEFVVKSSFIPDVNAVSNIREYQNFLFLFSKNGIAVFNGMGKQLRTIEAKGLNTYNFLGEELYFLQNNVIHFLDLFTADTRELKLNAPADFVLLTDERIVVIKSEQMEIFEFQP